MKNVTKTATSAGVREAAVKGQERAEIPGTMRAVAIDGFGDPEVLTLHMMPTPAVDDKEVLIKLSAAGVGIWDAAMRGGWWPGGKAHFPLILGTDGAGTVAQVGRGVRRFHVGDRVYAYQFKSRKGGFYAEYVAVDADHMARVPENLDLKHAGGMATVGLTALQGIDDALEVKKNETVIIHGASGGVGTMAVQFAKLRGARVLGTASGRDGVALVKKMGADAAVDGKESELGEAIADFAPDGVDAVLGLVGGDGLEKCLDALKADGRFAYPHGIEPQPKKRRRGSTIPYDAIAGLREFDRLNRAAIAAKLQVPITAEFPLADAAKAHERLTRGHIIGKIILTID